MSWLSWFSKKQVPRALPAADSSGLPDMAATVPLSAAERLRRKSMQASSSEGTSTQKNERLERREHLYGVVRDAMTRAGVLSASYKFKVLSLDVRGLQYLIMMDLTRLSLMEPGRMGEIEAMMAQSAKARYGIQVPGVYWRVQEQAIASAHLSSPAPRAAEAAPASETAHQGTSYEPLQADEVAAFKRAMASAAAPLSPSGQIVQSGQRNPAAVMDFEDTKTYRPEDRSSPLSGTQYGDLN